MSEQLPIGRGRLPGDRRARRATWLVTIAWAQLWLLLAWLAASALLNLALGDLDGFACFDEARTCPPSGAPSWFGAGDAVAAAVTLATAVGAVVVARRSSQAAALGAIGATWLVAGGSALVSDLPT
jgi:hypothetical protein